jgi:cytochrome c5
MKRHPAPVSPLKRILHALAIGCLITACAPLEKAAPPVSTLTLPKKADTKKLEAGRALYATSCTRCHGPARVDRHGSDEKWSQRILPRMCEKSKLTATQSDALKEYVLAARKSLSAPAAN